MAGTGEAGFTGDGALATNAQLNDPENILVNFDGSIVISDRGNNLVRLIGVDGRLRTIVGKKKDQRYRAGRDHCNFPIS